MRNNELNLSETFYDDRLKEKILSDAEISSDKTIDINKLISDAKEIKRILHLREKNKYDILDRVEKKIIVDIPNGTENTLINDLENFNNEFYHEPNNVFFNYIPKDAKSPTIENLEDVNFTVDTSSNETVDNFSGIEIQGTENEKVKDVFDRDAKFKSNYISNENVENKYDNAIHLTSDLLAPDHLEQVMDEASGQIIVDDEADKNKILDYVEENIDSGKFKLINIERPLQISGRKIHKKIKSIRQKFIDSYGSEIFRKVSNWIVEEQNLYNNLDRIERIERYKKNKMKLAKQMQIKNKLKRMFNK
jgi:hypothetical protein